MATATKKAHAATSTPRAVSPVPGPPSLAFLTYRDNGDVYHWEIVDASGKTLARSDGFTSQAEAESAACHVRDGVRSADVEPHVAEGLRAVAV